MDGTTAGNGPGPRTMYPVVKNVMLASADQVAIDAVAAKMMGFDPMSLEYIRLAHEDGLGVGDPRDIEIVGDVDAANENWELPGRRESGPRRRRRPDLVRAAQALPEAVLPHAAGQRLHPRQRRLPRLLPLAAHRSPGLRALVRNDRSGGSCSCATRRWDRRAQPPLGSTAPAPPTRTHEPRRFAGSQARGPSVARGPRLLGSRTGRRREAAAPAAPAHGRSALACVSWPIS